jgi:hypothetical protein
MGSGGTALLFLLRRLLMRGGWLTPRPGRFTSGSETMSTGHEGGWVDTRSLSSRPATLESWIRFWTSPCEMRCSKWHGERVLFEYVRFSL